jgi:hypothetical protein
MTQSQKGYRELETRIDNALLEGTKYVAGHYFEGIGSGSTVNIYLENPTESGRVLVIESPTVRSGKRIDAQLSFNPTVDTVGTDDPPKNRRSDLADSGVANAAYSGAYTATDQFDSVPVGSDTGSQNTYSSTEEDTAFAVMPGDSVLLQATTQNSDTDIRLAFDYIELPGAVVTE